jgi:hypothetical protein
LVRCSRRMSGMSGFSIFPGALPLVLVHQAMRLSLARHLRAGENDVTKWREAGSGQVGAGSGERH